MYPKHLLALFPPFPRTNRVFVAMASMAQFTARWERVIRPAIESLLVDDQPITAHRVDARKVSDSILTEIVEGIASDLLIFADISSLGTINGRAIRNGNVMYEVGIAHAVRLPEEVLLYRSDAEQLLFDVAGVRVNRYEPDSQPEQAKDVVVAALADALKEIDRQRHLAVQQAASALDAGSLELLFHPEDLTPHPTLRTVRDALSGSARLSAINRMLDLGVIEAVYATMSRDRLQMRFTEIVSYRRTPFGTAVMAAVAQRMGITKEFLSQIASDDAAV